MKYAEFSVTKVMKVVHFSNVLNIMKYMVNFSASVSGGQTHRLGK